MVRLRRRPVFSRRRSIKYLVFVTVCILVLLTSFIALDNTRIAVRRYDVSIPSLPVGAQGATLLHLSELHGTYYGPNHERLFAAIGTSAYDLVVITGDLVDEAQSETEQQAVLALVDQFALRGKPVYYVTGNNDPALTVRGENDVRVEHPFYTALAAHGAQRVDAPIPIELRGATLWLWPMELFYVTADQAQANLEALTVEDPTTLTYSEQLLYRQSEGILAYEEARQQRDVVVAVSHYPLTETQIEDFARRVPDSAAVLNTIDLMLAGHYHHGQIRLPLVGALFVPAKDQGLSGWFPDERKIYGLTDVGGVRVHISGGLGATGLLPIRVMATPEITFLKLTRMMTLN